MSSSRVDRATLNEFEQGLNVRQPDQSRIPARVLGYGEISTVLEIQSTQAGNLAYKRMPMFRDEAEVTQYVALYEEYVDVLQNRGGVQVVGGELIKVLGAKDKVVAYIAQEKLPPQSIAHRALQYLPADEVLKARVQERLTDAIKHQRLHVGERRFQLLDDGAIHRPALRHPPDDADRRARDPGHSGLSADHQIFLPERALDVAHDLGRHACGHERLVQPLQRRRRAVKGRALGRRVLGELAGLVLAWRRRRRSFLGRQRQKQHMAREPLAQSLSQNSAAARRRSPHVDPNVVHRRFLMKPGARSGSLTIVSDSDVEKIYQGALALLMEPGIFSESPLFLDIFAKGGASDIVIERNRIERIVSDGADAIGITSCVTKGDAMLIPKLLKQLGSQS